VILGGIYLGIFTPTEAGALGCVLTLLLALGYRRLSLKVIHEAALSTVEITSFIMLLVVGSAVLSNALAGLRIPHMLAQWVTGLALPPFAVLMAVMIVYLILGCLMEVIPIMLMTLPLTFPLITGLGYDPIWYGVIVVILMQAGTITPPVGICIYVAQGVSKRPLAEVVAGIFPFIIAILFLIVLVTAFPVLGTWLPAQMIGV
jgi:tripartite ATP-independent transporter DctM subunit